MDHEDEDVMELGIAMVASIGVWALTRTLAGRDPITSGRVAELASERNRPPARRSPILEAAMGLGRRLPGDREAIGGLLASAGGDPRTADRVVAARFAVAVAGALVGLWFGHLALIAAPILIFAGYRLPDFYLRRRVRARRDELARDLPDAVDLLAVCTQAGLNLPLSLERVADGARGPLGEELRRAIQQIRLGTPRAAALAELAERSHLDEVGALVGTLAAAERFGSGVVQALVSLSAELRLKRRRKAEEDARRAPVKMLFPLVFLILPGFVLLTLVPLLLGTFASLGF